MNTNRTGRLDMLEIVFPWAPLKVAVGGDPKHFMSYKKLWMKYIKL